VRGIANRFGGSHAQRDVLDLTLIEAALRAGQQDLAKALAAERTTAKPDSPLARLFARRAAEQAAPGEHEGVSQCAKRSPPEDTPER
jgi:hypothetical protein